MSYVLVICLGGLPRNSVDRLTGRFRNDLLKDRITPSQQQQQQQLVIGTGTAVTVKLMIDIQAVYNQAI